MANEKFDIKELEVSILIALIAAAVGGWLVSGISLKVAISSTILWGFFGFIAEIGRAHV